MTEAQRRGRDAEAFVAVELERRGWTVLERNVRAGRLELDIVARDGPVLVVVEVRARGAGSWVPPLETVDAAKRKRLRTAAEILWTSRYSKWPELERVRFDVAAVEFTSSGGPSLTYIEAAFV